MKKLYFLNEEEKERILKLHKSKQIGKTWLNEQDVNYGPGGKGVKYTTFYKNVAASVDAYCKNDKTTQIDEATLSIFKYATTDCTIFGMGYNTYSELNTALESAPKGVFCATYKKYKRDIGSNLIDKISGCIREVDSKTKTMRIINNKFGGDGSGLNFDSSHDDNTSSSQDDNTREKIKVPKSDWEKPQLDLYETYPCLTDVARATRAKNAVVVQNPSQHKQIIDKSQGKQTTITDETTFLLDGTYQTATDENRGEFSGKFECSPRGEKVLLYPGKFGMGGEGSIYSKWPCLGQPRKDGTPYTKIDSSDNNQAIMYNEERKTHPIFSGYPEGDIYFSSDGTFLTENDFNNDLEKSGRFKCKSKGRIFAAPFKGVSTEPIKTTPIVTTGGGGGSKTTGGMGVVSASAADVTEILKCANIGGSTLDQVALNKLYEYIKNNKK